MATLAQATQSRLSRSEWQAVAVAFNDAARSGCNVAQRPGLLGRLYVAVTGDEPRRPLADKKLEAIRGFVCETRRTRKPAKHYVPDLVAQGFTPAQVDALAFLSA